MFLKTRELNLYERYLLEMKDRYKLEKYDQDRLYPLEKGLKGETYFYDQVKSCIGGAKIWDLRLDRSGESQYDFVIVMDGKILYFDVKYYAGVYNYINGNFMSERNYVINNPLFKLDQQHIRLKVLIDKLGIDYELHSRVIFVGEQFHVKGYNGDKRILFHRDLEKIVESLNSKKVTSKEMKIARLLMDYHYDDGLYDRIDYYPFDAMRKGVKCPKCRDFLLRFEPAAKKVKCRCGLEYTKREIVRLAVDAVYLLKNSAVTPREVVEFSGIGRTTVKEVLGSEYKRVGNQRGCKYLTDNNKFFIKEDEDCYVYRDFEGYPTIK